MKKAGLIIALVAIGLFTLVPAASAVVHSGFGLAQSGQNSEGCAACHVTHAATAAKLLKFGTDQTTFCYGCHADDAVGSPYDAKNGRIWDTAYNYTNQATMVTWETAEYMPSYAGGFDTSFNFEDSYVQNGNTNVNDAVYYETSTSTHNVEGITLGPVGYSGSNPWDSEVSNLPGANDTFAAGKGTFRCGSCHDPHSADVGNNDRLLRLNSYLGVSANVDNVELALGGDNRPASYTLEVNAWCAGCHNVLNVGADAGHTLDGTTGKYMHAMGVVVNPAGVNVTMEMGTPISTDGGGQLVCLSCHRAHGTASDMNNVAVLNSWHRITDGPGADTGKGSVLLRLDNRDVCYNCHGAAARNKP